jgi:UPF0755 protein
MRYLHPKRGKSNWLLIILATAVGLFVAVILAGLIWFSHNLRPVSDSQTPQLFTVDEGTSANQIASGLQSLGLIHSSHAFVLYVNLRHYNNKLQAGTYRFKPSMSTQEIATSIANGYIDKNWLTILPGKRLDQLKQAFEKVGYSQTELDAAFSPASYKDIPIVASLPAGATLEGLLYPDSFQRASNTPAKDVIRQSIEELQSHLTPDIIQGFAAHNLTTYQGITMASIVYQESGDAQSQPTVAQVFLSRLNKGMMLGSDVTAFYAASLAGAGKTLGVDSPYNTRINTGLPPGPIGNMVDTALKAVAAPSNTDYLFFVAGDDGQIHFSHTEAEHQQAISKYCHELCS